MVGQNPTKRQTTNNPSYRQQPQSQYFGKTPHPGPFVLRTRSRHDTTRALGSLASAQSTGTEKIMDAVVQLLNYAASHPEAKVRYRANDMHLFGNRHSRQLIYPNLTVSHAQNGFQYTPKNTLQPASPCRPAAPAVPDVRLKCSSSRL